MVDRERELAKERGFDLLEPITASYERGAITKDEWHDQIRAIVESSYLAGTNVRTGSGFSGSEAEWETSRGLIMVALDRSGTFLDVGCANGLLMSSVEKWSADRGLAVEPYGVEISPRLADLARRRYPKWRERIWTANADGWEPPMQFDVVRTGLDYVPRRDREGFVSHLFTRAVAPGGRLVVGKNNEDRGRSAIADDLRSWGWADVREIRRPHTHPDVEVSVVWADRPEIDGAQRP